MHLEAYSDKLSDMLDKNQSADDKAREKSTKEIKEYKQMAAEKEEEVEGLKGTVEELTHTIRDKSKYPLRH